eukprot:g21772.t1
MPVVKVPLTESAFNLNEKYDPQTHKKHTVFAGTSLLKIAGTRGEHRAVAIVTRTGAQTFKGEILRNILFSARPRFSFDVQIELVLCVPADVGHLGTCLPPLLPTVFVVGVGISSQRLFKERVICTDPKRLLMAGKVRVAAFDKTGTLTKQGMDFWTVRACHNAHFTGYHDEQEKVKGFAEKLETTTMARGMAVCHTISKVEGDTAQMKEEDKIVGTMVDVQMFKASGYTLHKGNNDRV